MKLVNAGNIEIVKTSDIKNVLKYASAYVV